MEPHSPDVAGEVFDRQVMERRCRSEFVKVVSADDGILFFISANVVAGNLSVVELNQRLGVGNSEEVETEAQGAQGEVKQAAYDREWKHEDIPRQVRMVPVLSDLLRHPFEQRCRRIAILISAWDLQEAWRLPLNSGWRVTCHWLINF